MTKKTTREIVRIIIKHIGDPDFDKVKVGLIHNGTKMVKPQYADQHAYLLTPRIVDECRAIAKRMRKP